MQVRQSYGNFSKANQPSHMRSNVGGLNSRGSLRSPRMDSAYLGRQQAIAAIRAARHDIIRLAAHWEASHAVDTSSLNPALFALQEALATLESMPQVSTAEAAAPIPVAEPTRPYAHGDRSEPLV